MSAHEHEQFMNAWEIEAKKTIQLLRSLPANQYDFRPDAKGRSLGEMAWHLAEVDAYMTTAVEKGGLSLSLRPPGLERPRAIAELAPGYERVHRDAVARVRGLTPADYERTITFVDGSPTAVRHVLWDALLHHLIHHRGQLVLLCRMAGGAPPGIYGPNREESLKMMEAAKRGS